MTELEKFKERYGFNTGSVKWLPQGGELLKYIGQEVILIEYTKNEDSSWSSSYSPVQVKSIDSYDPKTNTYKIVYSYKDKPEVDEEERIIPEGYRFFPGEMVENTNYTNQFIPESTHLRCIEESGFYSSLSSMWSSKPSENLDNINSMIKSSDTQKGETLIRRIHLAAVIKTSSNDILYFRIIKFRYRTRKGGLVELELRDSENNLVTATGQKNSVSYRLSGIGELKIILL
jgi:hypothetical protein